MKYLFTANFILFFFILSAFSTFPKFSQTKKNLTRLILIFTYVSILMTIDFSIKFLLLYFLLVYAYLLLITFLFIVADNFIILESRFKTRVPLLLFFIAKNFYTSFARNLNFVYNNFSFYRALTNFNCNIISKYFFISGRFTFIIYSYTLFENNFKRFITIKDFLKIITWNFYKYEIGRLVSSRIFAALSVTIGHKVLQLTSRANINFKNISTKKNYLQWGF